MDNGTNTQETLQEATTPRGTTTLAPLTTEQLQRETIRSLRAQLFSLQQTAHKWENNAMHLRAELTFVQAQNDTLVLKLQTARRALDYCERAFGFKIPTTPAPTATTPHIRD